MADLRLYAQNEGALYQGGSGNDTVQVNTGAISASTLQGLAGNDVIFLGNETDEVKIVVSGGAGSAAFGAAKAPNTTAGYTISGFFDTAGTISKSMTTASILTAGTTTAITLQALISTGISGIATSTVNGNAGNDSIFLGDQLRNFVGGFIAGGAGNDLVGTYNSGGATTGKINAELTASTLNGGEGNDTVFVNFSGDSAKDFVINGNAGNDSVVFSSVSAGARSALIGGGKGADTILASFMSGSGFTVNGGDGNDTITLDVNSAITNALIQGDTLNTHSGDDTITIGMDAGSAVTIQGLGGNDSIVISTASGGGANLVAGNAGNDTIFFSAGAAGANDISGWTVNGGAGNDSILLTAWTAAGLISSLFQGGAGDDTITLAAIAEGSAGASGTTIVGGAGADALTNSAAQAVGGDATFAYSAYSDSTLSNLDTVTFNTAAISANAVGGTYGSSNIRLSFGMGGITLASGAGAMNTQVSASGGFILWSGYSDNSLTSRVSAIDASYTSTGSLAVFTTDNTTRYVFVQGGATDTVIKLSDEVSLTAGSATLTVTGGTAVGLGAT